MLLTADIGGTKTVLAAARPKETGIELSLIQRYESQKYASFEAILDSYLAVNSSITFEALCVAVAGPVMGNRCTVTNLGITVDGESISRQFKIGKTILINDLEASGYGLEIIPDLSLEKIKGGQAAVGNRVLVSPGTGLGVSFLHYIEGRHIPIPSEGGHADFAPFDGATMRLWSFLKRALGRVAIEDILSGPGMNNIYGFLASENGVDVSEGLEKELQEQPGGAITKLAVEQKEPLSIQTIRFFLDILAAEAGNLALRALPYGGVFFGGGIIPRLLPFLDKQKFASIMAAKGIHRPILEKIPAFVVNDTNLPLFGAARFMLTSGHA